MAASLARAVMSEPEKPGKGEISVGLSGKGLAEMLLRLGIFGEKGKDGRLREGWLAHGGQDENRESIPSVRFTSVQISFALRSCF